LKIDISKLKIEKGIPITAKKFPRTSQWTEFLSSLKVGDSFQVSKDAYNIIYATGKKLGLLLTIRTLDDDKNIRVWRIKKDNKE
jgi:hypothetical protein